MTVIGWLLNSLLRPARRAETLALYAVTLGVVILLFATNHATTVRIEHDEGRFISNGIATTTCLLEVFRNVQPALEQLPNVERPLHAFLVLQGARYGQNRCPDASEQEIQREAARLTPLRR